MKDKISGDVASQVEGQAAIVLRQVSQAVGGKGSDKKVSGAYVYRDYSE